jgi:putative endonuclease
MHAGWTGGKSWNIRMMHYVYILRSINYPDRIYVGHTGNLKKRLSDHNCGTTAHTEKYKPWELVVYLGFENEVKAIEFEKYLKSGSGRSFRQKRLM